MVILLLSPPFTAGADRKVKYEAHLQQCHKNSPCILSPPLNNILEFRGWKHAQKHPFAIYGDMEAFLVPTTTTDPLSPSDTLLNNAKKNFSIRINEGENVEMEHFVDFCDEGDEVDDEGVDDIEEEDVPTSLTEAAVVGGGGGGGKRKKSNKSMPDEEPHRKQLHPWLKSKKLEPTRKKARLDLATFVETNSVTHEHKMVMFFFCFVFSFLYSYLYIFRLVMHSM